MKQSLKGRKFLQNAEGLRLRFYIDAAGKATIGFGHKILPSERVLYIEMRKEITRIEAEQIYDRDLVTKEAALNEALKLSPRKLTQNQYDALVAFIFNIGVGAWITSTCRKRLAAGRISDIPVEMKRWVHDDDGNVIEGLVNRRAHEIDLFKQP